MLVCECRRSHRRLCDTLLADPPGRPQTLHCLSRTLDLTPSIRIGACMITDREADALSAQLIKIATDAAREAGAYIIQHAGRVEEVGEKRGFFDPVTECD